VPIIKPAQNHKYNTKTVKTHKNKTLNRQNKNNMTGQKQYQRSTRAKTLNPEKT